MVNHVALSPALTEAMVQTAFRATAALDESDRNLGFMQGDFVVYPTHGVGRVDRVGLEEVAGHRLHLIQISFSENRMILRVPLAKARAAGLRVLASGADMATVLTTLAGRPRQSRLLWAKRAQAYQARINSGDIQVLAEVVRDLQSAPGGSNSSYSQRNLFELALDRLAGEFAAVAQIDKASAITSLMDAMQRGRDARPVLPALPVADIADLAVHDLGPDSVHDISVHDITAHGVRAHDKDAA
jgi:CarD family transcriptional regulator